MSNKPYLTAPMLFFIGWIGLDLLRGRTLDFDKVVVGLLVSVIVGLVMYIKQTKK